MPTAVGKTKETSVHLTDFVSFFIVKSVVAHGQCKSENSMTEMAVAVVQPFATSRVRSSWSVSNSKILPEDIYAIMIIGKTISLAGIPKINAKSTTPSKPKRRANGSKKSAQICKRVLSPMCRLANSQMT